jgi:UDP-2,4-diacetamido-2,4,6-trideoxy-beta-L-altropyranose hydrolase
VRRADYADARMMYEWRNHPATRRVSRDQREIDWSEHCAWLRQALADPQRMLLIGVVGTVPVGTIRFDLRSAGEAEVSLYLDPALHGLALGPALLAAGERSVRGQCADLRRFSAVVLEENGASQRLFAGASYVREDRVRWSKEP